MPESIRPYIVINGKSSREISGLLIVSLPPITKSQMRVTAEEIDGRDGDIVTELGFSAYDKPVEIGLAGDYDINEVISYFNQAGVITFSNEPDKYYKFAQYNGIDFEKLIRFKKATVIFHVQPFKYDTESNDAVFWNPENISITNEGNIYSKPELAIQGSGNVGIALNGSEVLSLELGETKQAIIIDTDEMNAYGTKSNVKELITDINPVQDLHGYDSVWIGGAGKNKFECTATSQTINGVAYVVESDGTVKATGTASGASILDCGQITLESGKSYILSGCASGGSGSTYCLFLRGSGSFAQKIDFGSGISFTMSETITTTLSVIVYNGTTVNNLVFKPMVRLSSETDATFEPYENVCDISGWNGCDISRTGKNLFNKATIETSRYINANGNSQQSGSWSASDYIPVKPNTAYYLSGITNGGNIAKHAFYKADKSLISVINNTVYHITTPNECYFIRLSLLSTIPDNVQFELGNQATEFEAYNGQIITTDFGQTVFGGTLNVTTGLLTINKAIINNIANYYRDFFTGTYSTCYRITLPTLSTNISYSQKHGAISNCKNEESAYWGGNHTAEANSANNIFAINPLGEILAIYDADTSLTKTTFESKYANFEAVFPLASPVEIQLTAEEIQTLIGTNVIWSNTGDISECIYTRAGADVTTSGAIVSFEADASDLRDDILKNRLVRGNYDNLRLKAGANQIGITGDVDVLVLSNFSRWL